MTLPRWLDLAGNWDDPDKFIAAVRALQLSKQQISRLLQLRELWTEDVRRCRLQCCTTSSTLRRPDRSPRAHASYQQDLIPGS